MKRPDPELVFVAAWPAAFPLAIAGHWIGYGWMWIPILAALPIGFWLADHP